MKTTTLEEWSAWYVDWLCKDFFTINGLNWSKTFVTDYDELALYMEYHWTSVAPDQINVIDSLRKTLNICNYILGRTKHPHTYAHAELQLLRSWENLVREAQRAYGNLGLSAEFNACGLIPSELKATQDMLAIPENLASFNDILTTARSIYDGNSYPTMIDAVAAAKSVLS